MGSSLLVQRLRRRRNLLHSIHGDLKAGHELLSPCSVFYQRDLIQYMVRDNTPYPDSLEEEKADNDEKEKGYDELISRRITFYHQPRSLDQAV